MAAFYIAHLPGALVDELANECVLPDTAWHSVGACQRDGRASDIPSRRGETGHPVNASLAAFWAVFLHRSASAAGPVQLF